MIITNNKIAKQVIGEILKTGNMELMTRIHDYCADNGVTVHELVSDKQVAKALELKVLFPTQKTTETKEMSDLDRTLLYRSQLAEKAKTNMENMDKVNALLAEVATTTVPPVLFRITWDKGKKGMDVIGKQPIISEESVMLIVVMLQYNKEYKQLLQLNNVDALHSDYIKCENGKYYIHTNGGEWIPAEITNILQKDVQVVDEVKKPVTKKPVIKKPKAEKEKTEKPKAEQTVLVDDKKDEGKKEGE